MQNDQEYFVSFRNQTANQNLRDNRHFMRSSGNPNKINHTEEDLMESSVVRIDHPKSSAQKLKEQLQPARFSRSKLYKCQRSYFVLHDIQYKQIELFQDTNILKSFGLGPFFYIEFMRWMCWLFFILSILEVIRICINWKGRGLSDYSYSFSAYFISASLGNFQGDSFFKHDPYIVSLIPFASLVLLFLVSIIWKCCFYSHIQSQEEDSLDIHPQKFCVEVTSKGHHMTVEQLKHIFEFFGPIHQISIVNSYNDKLDYFEQLLGLQEEVKDEQLLICLQNGDPEKLKQLRSVLERYKQQMKGMRVHSKVVSAYVHFQFQKNKHDCLQFFNNRYLFDSCSHGFVQCFCGCCLKKNNEQILLREKYPLFIKNQQVPEPEDINWDSVETTPCGLFIRYFFALLMILLFLAFSCTIIGVCTIYISTHSSNCDSVNVPASLSAAQASTSSVEVKCYCNANLISSLTDASIKDFCSGYLKEIYLEQFIQIVIILVSSLTNVIFGFVIDKTIDCTKPSSRSLGLKRKAVIYTFFVIFNTVFLPILLYSNIFGFKSANYFSFLQIISTDASNFLQVDSLQFYLDYNGIWYRNVSPIFTNFLIFDTLAVWVLFVITKCRSDPEDLKEKQGKMLQKKMNQEITKYQLSVYKEYSYFLMVIFMAVLLNGGLPVLMHLAFLNLVSRYITNRSLLQVNSTRVEGLGISFDEIPHNLLTILLAMSGVNAAWMLTANSHIYPDQLSFALAASGLADKQIFSREFYLPFFLVISMLAVLQFFIENIFISVVGCLLGCCYEKKFVMKTSTTRSFSQQKRHMNVLSSYNIKSNDRFRDIVLRMDMYNQHQKKVDDQ